MKEKAKQQLKALNGCVIIPTYNNAKTLAGVIAGVKEYAGDIIVVNDGSTDSTPEILNSFTDIRICSYMLNKGKGYALKKGFQIASSMGFDYAITIDSDGQHFPSDIPLFIEKVMENPGSLIIGSRSFDQENMPGKNSFANKFSNFWYWVETGQKLNDTQSGFRMYPLTEVSQLKFFTRKYDFELEALVRLAWNEVPVIPVSIDVYYPPEGERVSHFKPFRDFTRISILNTILVLVAFFWVKPFSFLKKLNRKNIKAFFKDQILASSYSNAKITSSIMLGVFMGIAPVWGYQMLIAFTIAHWLKLNKTITLVSSNISIPPMIPLILFGSFAVGAWILGKPLEISFHDITFATVKQDLIQYIIGSLTFAVGCALLAGAVSAVFLLIFRKKK